MQKSLVLITAVVLTLALAACGGSGDDAGGTTSPGDAPSGDDTAMPEVTACRFVPASEPGDIMAGSATVTGQNSTDDVVDTTTIRFSLLDDAGEPIGDQQNAAISYWQPEEEVAMQVAVFSEETIGSADCEITDVRTGFHAEQTEFDADAATCEVAEADLGPANVEVDISEVADAPDDEELFSVVAVHDGETRVGEVFPTFAPGSTEAAVGTPATGDGLTCEVLQLRLP